MNPTESKTPDRSEISTPGSDAQAPRTTPISPSHRPPTRRPLAGAPNQCAKCGYSLIGLQIPGMCPECGVGFDFEPRAGAAARLPDPRWVERAEFCVGCGYSLDGLAAPGVCPECGLAFEAHQLILAGVPNRMGSTPAWRRVVWGSLIAAFFLNSQLWVLQIRLGWWFPLVTLGILGSGVALMLMTGPRERRGTERFVVVPSGITRVLARANDQVTSQDSLFVPWGSSDAVELTTISPYWKRLRVGRRPGRRLTDVVFDAGIRCRDGMDADVRATIESHLLADRPTDARTDTPDQKNSNPA